MKKKSKSHPPSASTQRFAAARPLTDQEVAEAIIRTPPLRLIDKAEVLRRVSVTFPTIWKLMRDNKFPRSRNLGGKSAWLEHEVEAWIKARPLVPIKGENQQKAEA